MHQVPQEKQLNHVILRKPNLNILQLNKMLRMFFIQILKTFVLYLFILCFFSLCGGQNNASSRPCCQSQASAGVIETNMEATQQH